VKTGPERRFPCIGEAAACSINVPRKDLAVDKMAALVMHCAIRCSNGLFSMAGSAGATLQNVDKLQRSAALNMSMILR
jgi:hypothetical protein